MCYGMGCGHEQRDAGSCGRPPADCPDRHEDPEVMNCTTCKWARDEDVCYVSRDMAQTIFERYGVKIDEAGIDVAKVRQCAFWEPRE